MVAYATLAILNPMIPTWVGSIGDEKMSGSLSQVLDWLTRRGYRLKRQDKDALTRGDTRGTYILEM